MKIMGTSPDVGGRHGLGRPLQPDYTELEQAAQTQVAKQGLGIVPNTIDFSFTEFGGNLWKYDSPATKPSVPMNVLKATSRPDVDLPNKLEAKFLKELFEELPLSLSLEMRRQRKLPYLERDGRYLVLDQILRFFAKMLAYCTEISEVDATAHAEAASQAKLIPTQVLRGWVEAASLQIDELRLMTRESGIGLQSLTKPNAELLEKYVQDIKRFLKEKDPKVKIKHIQSIQKDLQREIRAFRLKNNPSAMQSTGALLHALLPPVAALSSSALPAAMYSLISSSEISRKEHNIEGCFSEGYETIFNALEEIMPDNQMIDFPVILGVLELAVFAMSSTILLASGISIATAEENKNEQAEHYLTARSFAFTLASGLMTATQAIPMGARLVLEQLPLNETQVTAWTAGSDLLAQTVLLLAGDKGDKAVRESSSLINGIKPAYLEKLEELKRILKGKQAASLHAKVLIQGVRQAILALEKTDGKGLFEALHMMIGSIESDKETMQMESEKILETCLSLLWASKRLAQEGNFTAVVSQAA